MNFNNKGMTLVELIVTFALLLVVVVGLYNLILEVKFAVDEKQIVKNTIEFSSLINNDIHYDLLHDKPFAIVIKNDKNSSWDCHINSDGKSCTPDANKFAIVHENNKSVLPSFATLDSYCKNIYPCAVYFYVSGSGDNAYIVSRVIALGSVDGSTNGEVEGPLGKLDEETNKMKLIENGILYGYTDISIFEPVEPYDEKGFVEVRDGEHYDIDVSLIEKEDKPYIKFEDGMLIINYALYIVDDDDNKNYGFKIVYPFS